MTFLADHDKIRVHHAIQQLEKNSGGELVAVIAQASDDYLYIPLLWASLIALLLPGLLYFLATQFGWQAGLPHWGWGSLTDYAELYVIQIIVFCLLALCFRHDKVKMHLVPARVKHRRAHRHAHYCFLERGLHKTQARNSIMIFVSIAEHHVEILADQGINERIDHTIWQAIVDRFIVSIKAGEIGDGLLHAVAECGDLLSAHFPGKRHDRNELTDHIIEIN